MFCTRVAWAGLVCLLLCKEEGSSPVSLQLLRGGIILIILIVIIVLIVKRVKNCNNSNISNYSNKKSNNYSNKSIIIVI